MEQLHSGDVVHIFGNRKICDAFSHARVFAMEAPKSNCRRYRTAFLIARQTVIHESIPGIFTLTHNLGPTSNIVVQLWKLEDREGRTSRIVQIPDKSRIVLAQQCGTIEEWNLYWDQ